MSLTPRSEALPLHKLYACVSSNSLSDSSETTSQRKSNMNRLLTSLKIFLGYLYKQYDICRLTHKWFKRWKILFISLLVFARLSYSCKGWISKHGIKIVCSTFINFLNQSQPYYIANRDKNCWNVSKNLTCKEILIMCHFLCT